jgi:hypothetical protein
MTAGSQFPYPELNMKRMVDAGQLPGPRFHITGPYLNGGPPRSGNARILQTPEEARRVIAYWVSEGATWFKFQGTVSREILGAAILEAHKLGARVTGHLCSVTFTEAASLGIDLLQHGFITNSDYVPNKQPDVCPPENMRVQADVDVSSPQVQQSIRQIVADKAAVASTLAVYETFVAERAKLDPRAMEFLDPDVRKEVEQNHANIAKGGLTVPPRLIKKMMQWERDFVMAGGLLGSGSDPWGTGFLPGWGNLRNYELLIEAGFSPEQAIQIMTSNGAKILGEDGARGTIVTGKVADLVVIRGNPIGTPSDIYQSRHRLQGRRRIRFREAPGGREGKSGRFLTSEKGHRTVWAGSCPVRDWDRDRRGEIEYLLTPASPRDPNSEIHVNPLVLSPCSHRSLDHGHLERPTAVPEARDPRAGPAARNPARTFSLP